MGARVEARGTVWKWVRIGGICVFFVLGFWQFARAGFDWRAVLSMTNIWMFLLAMASLPVFGFPISACYIYAGLAFPPVEAAFACIAALIVNMSVSYALMHSVFKAPLVRFLESRGWAVPKLNDDNQFRFAFIIRTVPGPPFFFQNLVLGVAGIPFWTYLWVSLLAQGGIAIGVILCARYLSEEPWGKGGITVIAILSALLIAKTIRGFRKWRRENP